MAEMETKCSFCDKESTEVGPMAKGLEGIYICGPCLGIVRNCRPEAFVMGQCGFCGRKLTCDMHYAVNAADVFICFECARSTLSLRDLSRISFA
jgi:hypothetical protein